MPFKAYLPSGFEHDHENVSFDSLARVLNDRFGNDPAPHFLIGNVMFDGEELDAVFLKRNAISVIEMKNYGGMLRFSESTEWFADDKKVYGGRHINPFLQVRTYKFALKGCLQRLQREMVSPPRSIAWSQISGVVLFCKSIRFNEQEAHRVPDQIGWWFHVTDLHGIANKLASLDHESLQLTDLELQKLLELRGFQDRHLYSNALPPGQPFRPTSAAEMRKPQTRVVYHKESHFRDHEMRMRNAAGARSAGALLVRRLFDEVRQGRDPFSNRTFTVDDRVPGARIYQINDVCTLVMYHAGRSLYPFFLGDSAEVQQWLEANSGLTLAVDGTTGRITPTVVTTEVSQENLPPPSPTAENLPFFSRLKGLELLSLVPQRYVRQGIEKLDEESTDEDIVMVLESVPADDLRTFLFNLISLIRSGDIAGAEARIRLRNGEASPIEDAGVLGDDAVNAPANSDQVISISALTEHEYNLYNDPKRFQEWMLFLHEDQKSVAQGNFDRPVVLTGVSGSGKTCILVHRARYLARKYPNERIGVMTLNRSLAKLLENFVKQLCTDEERRNIRVMAFYDYFQELIHLLGPDNYLRQLLKMAPESRRLREAIDGVDKVNFANEIDLRSGESADETWEEFFNSQDPEVKVALSELERLLVDYRIDAARYLKEECTLIRSGLALTERTTYLDSSAYPRIGRGSTPQFLARQRQQMLNILLLFEEWMIHGAVVDVVELTQALIPLWREIRRLPPERRFRCLLVDEFQDLSTLDIRLLGHIANESENGLFLAGDTVQRILVKRLKLAEAGLAKGSFTPREIKKNYRNSRQILKAASTLANHYGKVASSQGEEIEVLDPELAQRETNPPIVLQTENQIRKAWELAIECIEGDKTAPWTVCIATAAPEKVTVSNILAQQPQSVEADLLSGDCILHRERMVVGTIHDLKGFEFRLVVIVGCDRGVLPAPGVAADEVWRDALRLYVAMTRAKDQLYLIYENEPSEFVTVMGETVVQRQEPLIRDYIVREPPTPLPATVVTTAPTVVIPAGWSENCESWFAEGELEILRRYFARHVYRDNLTFHEWCKPRILDSVRPELFFSLRQCDRRDVQRLLDRMRSKGLRLSPR
jgi:superfamily I DNA/RNA helicase